MRQKNKIRNIESRKVEAYKQGGERLVHNFLYLILCLLFIFFSFRDRALPPTNISLTFVIRVKFVNTTARIRVDTKWRFQFFAKYDYCFLLDVIIVIIAEYFT
jgi:hypothetical protein